MQVSSPTLFVVLQVLVLKGMEWHQSDALSLWLPGEQVFAGLEEQARQAMMKNNFPGALVDQRPNIHPLQDPDSSSSEFCPFQ